MNFETRETNSGMRFSSLAHQTRSEACMRTRCAFPIFGGLIVNDFCRASLMLDSNCCFLLESLNTSKILPMPTLASFVTVMLGTASSLFLNFVYVASFVLSMGLVSYHFRRSVSLVGFLG